MEALIGVKKLSELIGKSEVTVKNWIYQDRYHIKTVHLFRVGGNWMMDNEGYEGLIAEMKAEPVKKLDYQRKGAIKPETSEVTK